MSIYTLFSYLPRSHSHHISLLLLLLLLPLPLFIIIIIITIIFKNVIIIFIYTVIIPSSRLITTNHDHCVGQASHHYRHHQSNHQSNHFLHDNRFCTLRHYHENLFSVQTLTLSTILFIYFQKTIFASAISPLPSCRSSSTPYHPDGTRQRDKKKKQYKKKQKYMEKQTEKKIKKWKEK